MTEPTLVDYRIDLVVFDMAGTTVRDDGLVARAFLEAARRNGIEASPAEVAAWMGASKREVFEHLVARDGGARGKRRLQLAERLEAAYETFRRELEAALRAKPAEPIPGAVECLAWLRARGIHTALTTGFYRSVRDRILRQLGWGPDLVSVTLCGEDVAMGRPAPYMIQRAMEKTRVVDVHRVMNVGDTLMDCRSGQHAGAGAVVAVLTGGRRPEDFAATPHTHVLPSVAEIPALLESEFRA